MKNAPTLQELRGGYYTPPRVAYFLARWAVRSAQDHILEPSCGDGEIALAAVRRLGTLRKRKPVMGSVTAIEIETGEVRKTKRRLAEALDISTTIINTDFFEESRKWGVGSPLFAGYRPFDAIVGNPPFIRYQNFPEHRRETAFDLMRRLGLHPTGLTNAWVPFLVVSAHLLADHGRLAMVVPSELLQVGYAAETRQFLTRFFERLTIVTFRDLVFGTVQQDVVLLLAERRTTRPKGIAVFELDGVDDLDEVIVDEEPTHPVELDHASEKWLQYFLDRKQIELLRFLKKDPGVPPLGRFAEVDVGLVTGENSFFVLSRESARQLELWPSTTRIVSKSAQVQGLRFGDSDWEDCLEREQRMLLFSPPDADLATLPPSAVRYITSGEQQGVNSGYKCRIRKRWWVVPSQWVPDAFGLRQVHAYPRIILNHSGAQVTDTLHRIRFRPGVDPEPITAAFVNSLTLAASEVTGRSYGGGVLTFEPSEFESLPIPIEAAARLEVDMLDKLIRTEGVYACLDVTDEILLQDGLGLSRRDVLRLRKSWESLRDRRIGRRVQTPDVLRAG